MALSSTVLRALAQAGATTEMIIAAVEAAEAEAHVVDSARRLKDAERKRRSRGGASAMSRGQAVTPCDKTDSLPKKETSPTPPKEKTTLPENPTTEAIASSVAPAGQMSVQAAFDEFWAAYPKRDGANPKHQAFEKFRQRVRSGAEPEQIIAAAGRYAAECRGKGTFGSAFVTQAQTWLSQKRFDDYPAQTAEPGASSKPLPTTVTPGTAQWDAWYEFKRSNGTPTRLMDEAAGNDKPFHVPTEWPPTLVSSPSKAA